MFGTNNRKDIIRKYKICTKNCSKFMLSSFLLFRCRRNEVMKQFCDQRAFAARGGKPKAL